MLRTAQRQNGAVTTEQLLAAGLHRNAIAARVERGILRPRHRSVYGLAGAEGPLTSFTAAVLACGDAAVLSHRAAAAVWGIAPTPEGPIDVTITRGHRRNRPGIRVHHHPHHDVARRHGIPITTPRRTLQDLATIATPTELERALNEARILRLPLPASSSPDPGFTRSEAERKLLALIRQAGLPTPKTNTKVRGYEVDLHWPHRHLIVEFDGWTTHSSRAAFERDRRKDADLQLAGHRVLRVTDRQLANEPFALVARLAKAL
ncbi:MAG: type IV toxin-antitoxin system AbiEi family antitoxin domain-containing protein [Solirubrobacterales bacterium]